MGNPANDVLRVGRSLDFNHDRKHDGSDFLQQGKLSRLTHQRRNGDS